MLPLTIALTVLLALYTLLRLKWKWITTESAERIQFGVVTLMALSTIGTAIARSVHDHKWSQMAALIIGLSAVWLADLQGRRANKYNNPARAASIAAYLVVTILQHG